MSANQELFDVVIIGAGAAGITLALQLSNAGVKTALVEGGGYELRDISQSLYESQTIGQEYSTTNLRLRFFGGTTNHWSGWCRPLNDNAFTPRPSIGYRGWPIKKSALDSYLSTALNILDIPANVTWKPSQTIEQSSFNQSLKNSGFEEVYWNWSPPTRFKDKYLEELQSKTNLVISVNDSLINFNYTESGKITEAILQNIETNDQRTICGKYFVLACGGIENARLLLHMNQQNNTDWGNQSNQLGKNFSEHPHVYNVGSAILFDPSYEHLNNGRNTRFFHLNSNILHDNNLLPAIIRMRIEEEKAQEIRDQIRSISNLDISAEAPVLRLRITSEQTSLLENEIKLSDEKDSLGIGKTILNWQLSEMDYESLKIPLIRFAKMLIEEDIGRCQLSNWVLDQEPIPIRGGGHHIGTTRMSETSADGVVDTNCKLYGSQNLYIAGSSVFPTSGYANPTLTIVQLTLRLADHLQTRLES